MKESSSRWKSTQRGHTCPEATGALSFCVNGILYHGKGGLMEAASKQLGDSSYRFYTLTFMVAFLPGGWSRGEGAGCNCNANAL